MSSAPNNQHFTYCENPSPIRFTSFHRRDFHFAPTLILPYYRGDGRLFQNLILYFSPVIGETQRGQK